jgi:hypothetical protein
MATDAILVRRADGSFVAADPVSLEALDHIRPGTQVRAQITHPRNVAHHRLFFGALQVAFEAQDRFPTVEALLDALKIGLGLYDTYEISGRQFMRVRSIAFGAMDQAEFARFFDRAVALLLRVLPPGTQREDFLAMVDPDRRVAA